MKIKKYSYFLGLVLFIFILLKVDLGAAWQSAKNIKFIYILIASLATFPTLIVRTWCWNYILKKQNINYSLKDTFLMYCSGMYLSIPTPGKIGEFAKAFYLEKDGHSFGKSMAGMILERLIDVVLLSSFVFIGSVFFATVYLKQAIFLFFGLVIFAIVAIALIKTNAAKWILKKSLSLFAPEKDQNSLEINLRNFTESLKIYGPKEYAFMVFLIAIGWIAYFFQMYILALGIGIHIGPLYLSLAVTIAGLITLIPVSISGIGTRDAVLIVLLAPLAIQKEQAILFSMLILLMILVSAVIGLVCWVIKPIRF